MKGHWSNILWPALGISNWIMTHGSYPVLSAVSAIVLTVGGIFLYVHGPLRRRVDL